jgi:hypothetical protein
MLPELEDCAHIVVVCLLQIHCTQFECPALHTLRQQYAPAVLSAKGAYQEHVLLKGQKEHIAA